MLDDEPKRPYDRRMKPTKSYTKVKQSCRFCGAKRDGKRGLLCEECRRTTNREAQRKHRAKGKEQG